MTRYVQCNRQQIAWMKSLRYRWHPRRIHAAIEWGSYRCGSRWHFLGRTGLHMLASMTGDHVLGLARVSSKAAFKFNRESRTLHDPSTFGQGVP